MSKGLCNMSKEERKQAIDRRIRINAGGLGTIAAQEGLKPDSLSNRSKLRHLLIDAGHSNMRITHVEDNKEVQLFMY